MLIQHNQQQKSRTETFLGHILNAFKENLFSIPASYNISNRLGVTNNFVAIGTGMLPLHAGMQEGMRQHPMMQIVKNIKARAPYLS